MKAIRNYVYAAILAASALNFAPTVASAQEPARGKFTLTHEVHWGNAKVPAGDYEFSFDPDGGSRVLSLSKLSGSRAGYMVLVPDTDDAKPSNHNLLVLESTADGSYVSAMQLPEFGMTLHFTVPAHSTEIAKASITAAAAGQ
ncbi:MAG: hypothetical protein ABSG72_10865 [Candidatus Sulfotelmatobacter sp.]|jgi:hypothetical protein